MLLKEDFRFGQSGQRKVPLASRELSTQRGFAAMNKEEQREFIAQRFSQLDAVALANIVRAIFGHPHDNGRPRRRTRNVPIPASKTANHV